MKPVDELANTVRTRLEAGEAAEAWRALFPELRFDAGRVAGADGPALLALFAAVTEALAGEEEELTELSRAVALTPDDPPSLYEAAYALYEQGEHDVAASLLERAHRLAPDAPLLVTELAANLEALNAHQAAVERLAPYAEQDRWCRYLLAFHTLMTGRRAEAEAVRGRLGVVAADEEHLGPAVEVLDGMLARARALARVTPLDARDLTGWHAALNGSVLLHESPYGFDEGMQGRYAFVSDGYALQREGIEGVRAALAAAGLRPPRVIAGPDRGSRILAHATARLLDLPLVPFAVGYDEPGLVVIHDLRKVGDNDTLTHLAEHRRGQILWAHASVWIDPFPYTADLTTFLHQAMTDPWSGGAIRFDPETKTTSRSSPDEASDEEIAARIVAAPLDRESHRPVADLEAIVRCLAALPPEHAAGLFRGGGPRAIERAGGPVGSSRFF